MVRVPSRHTAAQLHALSKLERQLRAVDPYGGGRKYLRDYSEAFSRYERQIVDCEFHAALLAADVVLVGDYHALPRSQQFTAEVVEYLASTGREVVLGLEAFFTSDQSILDKWQSAARFERELAAISLRARLRFDEDWGYPWEPLYDLIVRAREAGAHIAALDQHPRRDLRSIGRRDRHAARAIASLRMQHPGAAVVVLFGESHLAPTHLPACLVNALEAQLGSEKRPAMLTLLQNVDALYWQAAECDRRKASLRCETGELIPAVRVRPGVICVFNASPLEKYESYRRCLERWHEE